MDNESVAKNIRRDSMDYTVYFNSKTDIPTAIGKEGEAISPFNTVVCQYQSKCMYYYDQKHSIGTDAKQSTHVIGLCTVGPNSTLTEISHAMFRLRKILYGTHIVVFAYVGSSVPNDIGLVSNDVQVISNNILSLLTYNEGLEFDAKMQAQSRQVDRVKSRVSERLQNHFLSISSYEIRNTNDQSLKTHTSVNVDQNIIRQSSISFNEELCDDMPLDWIDNRIDLESYRGCSYIFGIILSKGILGSLRQKIQVEPREYRFAIVAVSDQKVWVLKPDEYIHMSEKTRELLKLTSPVDLQGHNKSLQDLQGQYKSLQDLQGRFFLAKFMFGHIVSVEDLYHVYILLNRDRVMEGKIQNTIFALRDIAGLEIPESWFKEYIASPWKIFGSEGRIIMQGLNPEKIENVIRDGGIPYQLIYSPDTGLWGWK